MLQEAIDQSITRMVKMVFPDRTNHYNTLFGGTALNWMDEIAFITATRFSRQAFVTVSSDKVDFKVAIPGGSIVELIGKVSSVGNSSIQVTVDVWVEEMFSKKREKAIEGKFSLVCIGDDNKPVKIKIPGSSDQ